MKVYRVTFDDQDRYVEAPSFREAIEIWRSHEIEQLKVDGDFDEGDEDMEPDSVELVSDEPVMRVFTPTLRRSTQIGQ